MAVFIAPATTLTSEVNMEPSGNPFADSTRMTIKPSPKKPKIGWWQRNKHNLIDMCKSIVQITACVMLVVISLDIVVFAMVRDHDLKEEQHQRYTQFEKRWWADCRAEKRDYECQALWQMFQNKNRSE